VGLVSNQRSRFPPLPPIPWETIMHATTALQYIRKTSATLRSAWTAYTLKRAIADVASMNDQDYRTFGLDKAEILGALTRLHAEVEHNGRSLARVVGRKGAVAPLAIVVTKREPGARPASEQFYEILSHRQFQISPGPCTHQRSGVRQGRRSYSNNTTPFSAR